MAVPVSDIAYRVPGRGEPHAEIVEQAIAMAKLDGCRGSRRGVVIFDPETRKVFARGRNAPPRPFKCDNSADCNRDCGKICVHAEQEALYVLAGQGWSKTGDHGRLELVHVKVVDGALVAGGPPSCWQCSRAILAAGLYGVWLYEGASPQEGAWHWYSAVVFHRLTIDSCGLYPGGR